MEDRPQSSYRYRDDNANDVFCIWKQEHGCSQPDPIHTESDKKDQFNVLEVNYTACPLVVFYARIGRHFSGR